MDLQALDKALQAIALKRTELSKIDYSSPKYDDLEKALQDVHDEYSPDTDVLYPIAYIAKAFSINEKNEFSAANTEGVYVEVDKLPNVDTRLVILPNPTRIVMNIGKEKQQLVWTAK